MQKGQVSFDLILAIIVALIFVGGIHTLNNQMEGAQRHSAVKNQEKLMALQIHNVVSAAKTMSETDGLIVTFQTKKLLVPGDQFLGECFIDLGANTISYPLDGAPVVVDIPDYGDTSGFSIPASVVCGEALVIEWA